VPAATILDLYQPEQAALLTALRRARYGYLLALHVLLLCASGKTPTEISDCLYCSRSSVYRIVRTYRAGTLGFSLEADGRLGPPIRTTVLLPWLRRALLAVLKRSPHAFGWCRTRSLLRSARGRTRGAARGRGLS
jgi:Homeodomain-like domain